MGFAALSVAARKLEVYVQGVMEAKGRQGTLFSESQIADVDMLLDALLQAAISGGPEQNSGPTSCAQPVPFVPESDDGRVPGTGEKPRLHKAETHSEDESKIVFLLEADVEMAKDLATQISHFGYQVRVFSQWGAVKKALDRVTPIALIASIHPSPVSTEQRAERNRPVTAHRPPHTAHWSAQCPLIFISEYDDMSARLQAVRMGGTAYFTKPVGVDSIVSKLDEFVSPQASDPFRILVIDDEPELAGYHASILESAGMLTMVISDPMQTLTALLESKPDLILMDMHMPGCTGLELAGVIRQQEAYVSVPIVYLSAETDVDKQLAAMRLGGDSFLTKPIRPEHLISAVRGRVERLRVLRSFMVRDSLTGLLNHTVIKEQLTLEVARSMRAAREDQKLDMCFALVDIDHFKLVNDTYGHPTGDRVIKSISRLLQQRLRKSDMVGRYGGEEFAIILPNTREAEAVKLLDELRNGFSQVRHQGPEGHSVREFYVTFSAGVAQLSSQLAGAGQLSIATDRALYEAKALGRNCVAVASTNQ
jgi:diguanylate cyclase (GGDEF)-like protein